MDTLTDASGILPQGMIQAVQFSPGGGITIAPTWIWAMPHNTVTPANPPVSTDILFHAGGATQFVETANCATCFEDVHLLRTFFPAAQEMRYKDDCVTKSGSPATPGSDTCLIYPVPATPNEQPLGARSNNVLLVPDVSGFNLCNTSLTCPSSHDFIMVELDLYADKYKDFLVSGQNYNATWWLRSPGEFAAPPLTPSAYNNRLCRFEITFSYSVGGSAWADDADSLGGAGHACAPPDIAFGCLNRATGCPVRLLDAGAEPGGATLYLNDPADPAHAPYTPYSFSFTPGATVGTPAPDQWHATGCDDPTAVNNGMNAGLCRPVPWGLWKFMLTTDGNGNVPDTASTCRNAFGGPWPGCENARAAASLYIDGLSLTAGTGRYMSPIFDSLSPNTQWTRVEWELDLSLTTVGGIPRTPVDLELRAAATTTVLTFSNTEYTESLRPTVVGGPSATLSLAWAGAEQYFQFQTRLSTWDQNLLYPPPPKPGSFAPYCLRYGMQYDGSLSPSVKRISVTYSPDAGRIISAPISPARLRRWGTLTYQAAANQGFVVADILASPAGPVILRDVKNGGSLAGLDPGNYPSLCVQFTLTKGGNPAADPRVTMFKVKWEPMLQCLSLDHNSIRLSRAEPVQIRFCTATAGLVDVKVHDAAGQLVKKVFHGELAAGTICQKAWNGRSDMGDAPQSCSQGDTNPQGTPVSPGVYFVTVIAPGSHETARLAVSR